MFKVLMGKGVRLNDGKNEQHAGANGFVVLYTNDVGCWCLSLEHTHTLTLTISPTNKYLVRDKWAFLSNETNRLIRLPCTCLNARLYVQIVLNARHMSCVHPLSFPIMKP